MKVFLLGSTGFVGMHLRRELQDSGHKVVSGVRYGAIGTENVIVDLLDYSTIVEALDKVRPDVVVSCAGIIDKNVGFEKNVAYTKNLLDAIVFSRCKIKRILLTGSAAEYGHVSPEDLPVKETCILRADSGYGLSKKQEGELALGYATKKGLPITIARIFNPIGVGMKSQFLIPNLLEQLVMVKSGQVSSLRIGRLDAERDYINIRDVSRAQRLLIEKAPRESVYNIGSGQRTSNGVIIEKLVGLFGLTGHLEVQELMSDPEPLVACQADISRMKDEFNWIPRLNLNTTLKELVDARTKQ